MCFIPHAVSMGPFPVPNHSSVKFSREHKCTTRIGRVSDCPPVFTGGVISDSSELAGALRLLLGVCLCESARGISPFGPALLVPSEQPGQGTQAQFGGSQLRLNCKENIFKKSTSGSVLNL